MKRGYFDWVETSESYAVVLYLSAFHNGTVIDLMA